MRKIYLDNLRCAIVLLVIFYHIVYLFNSVGVISNVAIEGILQFDIVLYIIYPWFMACLFVIAGMSACYALSMRTGREFLKERVKKLLVPSVAGIFLLGWIPGLVTNQYADLFLGGGGQLPGFVKYIIYCFCGIGPLWFAHELFLASLVLLLVRKLDKNDRIRRLGGKVQLTALVLLVFAVWGSSHILNTPVVEVYRNGFYIFMFLLGYYVFSHDSVQEILEKYVVWFLGAAVLLGTAYVCLNWGENYAQTESLTKLLPNLYAWFMILAVLGCGKKWLNREMRFTRYLRPRSFGFYVLHLPLLVVLAYGMDLICDGPPVLFYAALLIGVAALLPLIYELLSRIPVLKSLLFGIYDRKKRVKDVYL